MVSLGDVPNTVILFVVIAIVAAIGLQIVGDVQNNNEADSIAYNATADVQEGASALFGFMPTIGLVVAAAIIIGLVVRSFMTR